VSNVIHDALLCSVQRYTRECFISLSTEQMRAMSKNTLHESEMREYSAM